MGLNVARPETKQQQKLHKFEAILLAHRIIKIKVSKIFLHRIWKWVPLVWRNFQPKQRDFLLPSWYYQTFQLFGGNIANLQVLF